MIKLVIKLAIAALLANATWRTGSAYAKHYRFTDAVQQVTLFRGAKTDEQIHDRVFELASQYDIPVSDENLTVSRQDNHTVVNGSYTRPIDLFPGYRYPWPFTVHVDTFVIDGAAR